MTKDPNYMAFSHLKFLAFQILNLKVKNRKAAGISKLLFLTVPFFTLSCLVTGMWNRLKNSNVNIYNR